MRIGVDATCWQNTRGYGRHARALLGALVNRDTKNRYTFFMDSDENAEHATDLPAGVARRTIRAIRPTVLAASANGHRSAQDMLRMARAMSSPEFDLLFFPTIYSYVPVLTRAKKIVMIHDVIAEKYPDLAMKGRRVRLFWKTKVALGRWQADAIATVSDYSRRGLIEHFNMKPDQVHVIGEASDPVFRVLDNPTLTEKLRSLGLSEGDRTIVFVGGFSPHKNLEILVRKFAKISERPDFVDVRLVLVGEHGKEVFQTHAAAVKQIAFDLGLKDRIVFTGYLPDEEVVVLLNLATVCVLPSLIEGFGLPAVEAAASGCPVIATSESPLPSLLGEGGIYFNPLQPDELEAALIRVLESPELQNKMSNAGRLAASKLTWDAAAQQMMNLIEQVIAS